MKRIIFVFAICALLMGCPPMDRVLKSRDIQRIEVGYAADQKTEQLITSDQEVDEFAKEVTIALKKNGFNLAYSSASWGLLPLTGHTQNMSYKTKSSEHISCSVTISKSEFTARFVEYEKDLKSNAFITTEEDKALMSRAASVLTALAKSKFSERSIRVSVFQN
ncbi:MAG: hypothetical protein ABW185_04535 [Sedimenticola sp.]